MLTPVVYFDILSYYTGFLSIGDCVFTLYYQFGYKKQVFKNV